MLVISATAALRAKISGPPADGAVSTGGLGGWYAGLVRRRRSFVLLINERTLLPALLPLAPAKTFGARVALAIADVLAACGLPEAFIDAELAQIDEVRIGPTSDRGTNGVLTHGAQWLARWEFDDDDLLDLALRLAALPQRRLGWAIPVDAVREAAGLPRRPRPALPDASSAFPAALPLPGGGEVEIRLQPGLAADLMEQLKPLMRADGVDLDDPNGAVDLATLQAAMDRAVVQHNAALATPVGARRDAATGFLTAFAAVVQRDDPHGAAAMIDRVQPEPPRPEVPGVAAVTGVALAALDALGGRRVHGSPPGLLLTTRVSKVWRGSSRATADLLALGTRGRATDSLHSLTIDHGGLQVLIGASLALALAAVEWSRRSGEPVEALLARTFA